jgi:8-oxo-dGTP pyrophosphatase MutT (NUDIX family)
MDFNSAIQKLKQFEIDEHVKQIAHMEVAPFRNLIISNSQVLNAKKAAVLLLVHSHHNKAYFTLIERSSYDGVHSKQIALPGGKVENEDLNISDTALREAHEEVNIIPSDVQVITTLSNIYIPPSNFYITPILGISEKRPKYIAEEKEVNNILEIPLSALLNPSVLKQTTIKSKKGNFKSPYLDLHNKIVWGATAMILNELKHFFYAIEKLKNDN